MNWRKLELSEPNKPDNDNDKNIPEKEILRELFRDPGEDTPQEWVYYPGCYEG